jgi:hypothetical protein
MQEIPEQLDEMFSRLDDTRSQAHRIRRAAASDATGLAGLIGDVFAQHQHQVRNKCPFRDSVEICCRQS